MTKTLILSAFLMLPLAAANSEEILAQTFNDSSDFTPGVTVDALKVAPIGNADSSAGLWFASESSTGLPAGVEHIDGQPGDQAIKITRTGVAATGLIGYTETGAITQGAFEWSVAFRRPNVKSALLFNINSLAQVASSSLQPLAIYWSTDNDAIYVRDPEDSKWEITPAKVPLDTWATFRAVVDLTKGTWSAWLTVGQDEEELFIDRPFARENLQAINAIRITPQGENGTVNYVDHISIKSTP